MTSLDPQSDPKAKKGLIINAFVMMCMWTLNGKL